MISIWVDVRTGTWGDFDDLRVMSVSDAELEKIASASDDGRIMFADKFGIMPILP